MESNIKTHVTFNVLPALSEKITLPLTNYLNQTIGQTYHFEPGAITIERDNTFIAGALFEVQGEVLWVEALWVEPSWQRQGMGTRLMHSLQLLAKEKQCQCLQLNTYFPQALSFFQKQGFEIVQTIKKWKFGLDCTFMQLRMES